MMPVVEVPVGPQHPALHEPILLKVYVEGEVVTRVEVVTGYNHRGIEKLLENATWMKALYITSRVCGICNLVHATTYVQALEAIQGIEPPPRALALRTLALELERLHSHMLIAAVMAEIIGFESLFMLLMRDRERVMYLKEVVTGNRVLADYVWPGGVRRDLPTEARDKILRNLRYIRERLHIYIKIFEEDVLIRRRLEGVGVIKHSEALERGLVGPTARASKVDIDVRRDDPYAWYSEVDFNIVVMDAGDAHARMMVRLYEALESISIVEQVLEKMPQGQITSVKIPPRSLKPGTAISRTEAPRGELIYHVFSRGGSRPWRVKIRTPSFTNILNGTIAFRDATLADVPVILASFDPCISCMERLIVIDEKTGRRHLAPVREVARGRWRPR